MLVHKGDQINNVQLITGMGTECRDVTTTKLIAASKYPKSTVGILYKKETVDVNIEELL